MIALAITYAALTIVPPEVFTGLASDECSSIEINHFYNDYGKPFFDQVIFYEATDTGE